MAELILDGKKWARYISNSQVLRDFLKNENFLREQIEKVLTMYRDGADIVHLVEGLTYVLGDDSRVIDCIERITKDNVECKSLLHWYAICVYANARELNLVSSRIQIARGT